MCVEFVNCIQEEHSMMCVIMESKNNYVFISYLAPVYHFHLSCRLWALNIQMLSTEYHKTVSKLTNVSCCVAFFFSFS
jgi:hypothetical protein